MRKILFIILINLIGFFSVFDFVNSQEESYKEFLEWCEPQFGEKCLELYQEQQIASKTNYGIILVSILIIIASGIIGNYFWSKRKGREYSEE